MDVVFYDSNRVEALGPVGLPPKLGGDLDARLQPCNLFRESSLKKAFGHPRAMAAWEINPLDTKGANLGEPGL
jgi:hypothetical protein